MPTAVIYADHLQRLFPELALDIVSRPIPKSADDARRVLRMFLVRVVGPEDRWGKIGFNWRGEARRYELGEKVIRSQYKGSYGWANSNSASLLDEALAVYAEAARMTNRTDLLEKIEKKGKSRTAAAKKGAEARGKERERTSSAGFYVINASASPSPYKGRYMADHEAPFSSADEAIEFGRGKLRELVSLKLDYLMPVAVIESNSRDDANFGRGHVWWLNGRYIGPASDPRQLRIPGTAAGRSRRRKGRSSGRMADLESEWEQAWVEGGWKHPNPSADSTVDLEVFMGWIRHQRSEENAAASRGDMGRAAYYAENRRALERALRMEAEEYLRAGVIRQSTVTRASDPKTAGRCWGGY